MIDFCQRFWCIRIFEKYFDLRMKLFYFSQIKNFDFWQTILIFDKILIIDKQFWFLTNNFDFWQNVDFDKQFWLLAKILIFYKILILTNNFDYWQKKTLILNKNSDFRQKISIFYKFYFWQNFRFLRNFSIFLQQKKILFLKGLIFDENFYFWFDFSRNFEIFKDFEIFRIKLTKSIKKICLNWHNLATWFLNDVQKWRWGK